MLKAIQLPPSNYLITYYQTLDEVTRLLRNKTNVLKNLKKMANFIKKTSKSRKVKLLKTNPLKL